jgi:hypothetical protein
MITKKYIYIDMFFVQLPNVIGLGESHWGPFRLLYIITIYYSFHIGRQTDVEVSIVEEIIQGN